MIQLDTIKETVRIGLTDRPAAMVYGYLQDLISNLNAHSLRRTGYTNHDPVEEIMKYKQLYNDGAITLEEFEGQSQILCKPLLGCE